jgi:hypothetical protein
MEDRKQNTKIMAAAKIKEQYFQIKKYLEQIYEYNNYYTNIVTLLSLFLCSMSHQRKPEA